MANDKEKYERLERYLAGAMTAEERSAFEAEIAADKELQTDLELHQEIETTLGDRGEAALEATLRKMRPTASPKVRRFTPWIAAAATIALLITVYFVWTPGTTTELSPIASYLSEAPMDLTVLGDQEATLDAAQQAYNTGDYPAALENLQLFLAISPEHESARIFAARAAIATGEYATALEILDFFNGRSSLNIEEATWLQALSLAGMERWEEVRELLRALQNATTPEIREKAATLARSIPE